MPSVFRDLARRIYLQDRRSTHHRWEHQRHCYTFWSSPDAWQSEADSRAIPPLLWWRLQVAVITQRAQHEVAHGHAGHGWISVPGTRLRVLPVKRAMIVVALIGGVCAAVQIVSADGVVGELLLIVLGEDTSYAPGYSEEAFESIRIGDEELRVRTTLGEPLDEAVLEMQGQTSKHLDYTLSPSSSNYRQRTIVIVDGRVLEKVAGAYLD